MCIIPGSNYFPFQESLIILDVEMRPGTGDPSHFERETLDLQPVWLFNFCWASVTSLKSETMMSI